MKTCVNCDEPRYSQYSYCYECYRSHRADYNQRVRAEVLELLGNECIRCGFTDPRALQIDHINGGGSAHRKKMGYNIVSMRKYVKEHADEFQLLCANCNWIKRFENKEHKERVDKAS